jgi:hypothetical protein
VPNEPAVEAGEEALTDGDSGVDAAALDVVGVPFEPWLLHAARTSTQAAPSATIIECRCIGEPSCG